MEIFDFAWYNIVMFLVLLTILVFFHELGHFWIARRNGVRVEVFSVGFGPEVFGFTDKHQTRWRFSAVPLGGYVKMLGEGDFEDDGSERELTEEEKKVSFAHKRLGQRAAIVAAGPIANFILAVIIVWGVFATIGMPVYKAAVGEVVVGSAADEAGLQTGDLILAINEENLFDFSDLSRIVSENAEVPLTLHVQRGEQTLSLTATPKTVSAETVDGDTVRIGRLGVRPDENQVDYQRAGPIEALGHGAGWTWTMITQILSFLGDLFTGQQDADQLGGPLRIAEMSGDMAKTGIAPYFMFMAALSVNLGMLNLFPIPMLDGGHLAFYAVEALRGRPLGPKAQEYGFRFGMILVLLLMVYVTWNDIVRIYVNHFGSL